MWGDPLKKKYKISPKRPWVVSGSKIFVGSEPSIIKEHKKGKALFAWVGIFKKIEVDDRRKRKWSPPCRQSLE